MLCISELEIWLFLTAVGVQWQMKSEKGLEMWRKARCKNNECDNYKRCLRLLILVENKHRRIYYICMCAHINIFIICIYIYMEKLMFLISVPVYCIYD